MLANIFAKKNVRLSVSQIHRTVGKIVVNGRLLPPKIS